MTIVKATPYIVILLITKKILILIIFFIIHIEKIIKFLFFYKYQPLNN